MALSRLDREVTNADRIAGGIRANILASRAASGKFDKRLPLEIRTALIPTLRRLEQKADQAIIGDLPEKAL